MRNAFCGIALTGQPDALRRLTATDGHTMDFAPPSLRSTATP